MTLVKVVAHVWDAKTHVRQARIVVVIQAVKQVARAIAKLVANINPKQIEYLATQTL